MIKMFFLLVTAALAFAGSAYFSWSWQHRQNTAINSAGADSGAGESAAKGEKASSAKRENGSTIGSALPPRSALADEAAQLAASLRERLAAAHVRETQLTERQKQLDLVYQDIRGERAALEELHKETTKELKLAEDKLTAAEKVLGRDRLQPPDAPNPANETLPDPKRVKTSAPEDFAKTAAVFAALPATRAAEMLQKLAESGKMELAARLLNAIPARQAAKVLAEIPTPELAEKILDKQKGLKPESPP
jgi:chromosome segregation ATPase